MQCSNNGCFFNSCIEVPEDESCQPQLITSFYAPATVDSNSQILREFRDVISQLNTLDVCRAFFSTMDCMYRFPACNATTRKILPICPDICSFVDTVVNLCTEEFRNNPDFPALNQLLDIFMCLEPQSYYNLPAQYIETNPNDCLKICKYIHKFVDYMYRGMRPAVSSNKILYRMTFVWP